MITVSLEEQIEVLKAASNGYMMMAMAMKIRCEGSMKMYLKEETKCFALALDLEDKLNELNSYMIAA